MHDPPDPARGDGTPPLAGGPGHSGHCRHCRVHTGPIAINTATFVGYQVCGTLGAFCATLGVVLPSFLIILLVARFYGARHADDVEKTVHSALLVSIAAGVLLLLIGLLGSPALLHLLNTKEDLYPALCSTCGCTSSVCRRWLFITTATPSSAPLARRKSHCTTCASQAC
mgnify:CR=1 FL=1